MKSNISGGIISLVLVMIALSSLVSMIALTRIDNIVHRELYNYGLKFNYSWAMPYWTMTTIVFAMGWFNIIAAIAFQFYVLLFGRRRAETMAQKEGYKPEVTYQPPQEAKPVETVKVERREVVQPVEAEPQASEVRAETQVEETPTEYPEPYEEPEASEYEVSEEPSYAEVPAEEPGESSSETTQEVGVQEDWRAEETGEAERQEEFQYSPEETSEEEQKTRPKPEEEEAEVTETSTY
jgi:Ca2+/Na+ antiporter